MLLPLVLPLTLQSLRQQALVARGCCHPAVGVAEAGRGHAVRGVLEEGVQEPETICQNQMRQDRHRLSRVPLLVGVWKHRHPEGTSPFCLWLSSMQFESP